ncbi:MAG: ATP-binding protein [Microcoleaceae cyanobacterium]
MTRSSLQVPTDLNALEEILTWFETLTLTQLPKESLEKCKIVLTEAFTNTVRHAHRQLAPTTPIDMEVMISSDAIEMRVWDSGEPFDLEATLNYVDGLHRQDPLKYEGKRGLLFMSKLTDELYYQRTSDERNCLVMKTQITHQ